MEEEEHKEGLITYYRYQLWNNTRKIQHSNILLRKLNMQILIFSS